MLLAGCDRLSDSARFVDVLGLAEPLSQRVQRELTGGRLAAGPYDPGLSVKSHAYGLATLREPH